MAFKGIFWIKPPCELVALKVKCDFCGNLLDDIPGNMLSKSGKNFNHKNAWNTLPKSATDRKPFNYYPRGRVEIKNGKATVFSNYLTDELKQKIIDIFFLSTENTVFKIDNSAHYTYLSKEHGLF